MRSVCDSWKLGTGRGAAATRRPTSCRMRLQELAEERRRWGYRRLHILLKREGWKRNSKRVYRIYSGAARRSRSSSTTAPSSLRRRWISGRTKTTVTLHFITPGRPMEYGFIESFHGRFREECLKEHRFLTLDDARQTIENGASIYNRVHPHSSLGYLTPGGVSPYGRLC